MSMYTFIVVKFAVIMVLIYIAFPIIEKVYKAIKSSLNTSLPEEATPNNSHRNRILLNLKRIIAFVCIICLLLIFIVSIIIMISIVIDVSIDLINVTMKLLQT
jgi:hypothetical protein